jgi:hypothetical protein
MRYKSETIIIHSRDVDGSVGAWVAQSENSITIKWDDSIDLNKIYFKKCTIIFIGVIVPLELYVLLRKDNNNRVIILDNKITNRTVYEKFLNDPDIKIELNSSCAMITWQFFNKELPPLKGIQYINGYITHRSDLSAVDRIYAYLNGRELTNESISYFMETLNDISGQNIIAEEGRHIQQYMNYLVEAFTKKVYYKNICDYRVPFVCCDEKLSHAVAKKLCVDNDFACAWYIDFNGYQQIIMKSRKGGIDVGAIAKRYGGRGYEQSASFTIQRKDFFIL